MNLRAQILAFAAPHGIRVAALYDMLRSLGRERVDYALLGLLSDGSLVRVGDVVTRPAHTLSVACSRCHEPRRMDEMLDSGLCIRCVSDAVSGPRTTVTHRTCPRCERELTIHDYGHGSYCPPCGRIKQREWREAHSQRKAAEYQARAERYRAEGKTARGMVRAGIKFGRAFDERDRP